MSAIAAIWDRVAEARRVFHLPRRPARAAAADDPDADFHANVTPMRHLLAACRQRGVRPIVLFAGTVTEAGMPSRLPVDEDAPDDPITIYDRHKLMAEDDLKAAASQGVVSRRHAAVGQCLWAGRARPARGIATS